MNDGRKVSLGAVILSCLPLAALLTILAILGRDRFLEATLGRQYERHREFWGGNPAEVYSHWLNMIVMSGNAASLAWLLSVEAFLRKANVSSKRLCYLTYVSAVLGLLVSGGIAVDLDHLHGEGTVLFALVILFVPILSSTYYLLRQLAALVRWRLSAVAALSTGYAAFHAMLQFHYEPSETGAPSARIFPIWLESVGVALVWAVVQSIRTGRLLRFLVRVARIVHKPFALGSAALIIFAVRDGLKIDKRHDITRVGEA